MSTVSIKEAKNRFSELARRAEKGETVTVTRNGTPVCEITAPKRKKAGVDWDAGERYLRERGADRVVSWMSPDFNDPLPEDFLLRPLPLSEPKSK